jgi:hypothetical protein
MLKNSFSFLAYFSHVCVGFCAEVVARGMLDIEMKLVEKMGADVGVGANVDTYVDTKVVCRRGC